MEENKDKKTIIWENFNQRKPSMPARLNKVFLMAEAGLSLLKLKEKEL